MKISRKVKEQTRIRLLEAAVDVISEKGFDKASMREIAKRADVADATIYNYFSTKEKLLYGYCAHVQQQVMHELKAMDDFHEFSLRDQLHQLVEMELQMWLPAREFLQVVFSQAYAAPTVGHELLADTKDLLKVMVVELIDASIEAGEMPEQPYQDLLPALFWDYQTAILAYWLKDTSDEFANTTQLVDQSTEIIAQLLMGGVIGKTLDLFSFLFRTHVLQHMNSLENIFLQPELVAAKRRFMQGEK
ncbi:TetR/AcrR family transcriptional regulator [Granulosicoccus sp.]|nr:TetR/AcrR family transcriptional regulator [Granulosicoccus sp.]MDB4223808.1 TetR/AcrR family transcriptional regulator [Granulosicoccus sp.]